MCRLRNHEAHGKTAADLVANAIAYSRRTGQAAVCVFDHEVTAELGGLAILMALYAAKAFPKEEPICSICAGARAWWWPPSRYGQPRFRVAVGPRQAAAHDADQMRGFHADLATRREAQLRAVGVPGNPAEWPRFW